MADLTATQKQLLMAWTMIVTNDNLFRGIKPIDQGATDADALNAAKPVLKKLAALGQINPAVAGLIGDSLRNDNFSSLQTLRSYYQAVSSQPEFWGGSSQDHPPLTDLKGQFDK